jgi:hypothetical protein
LAHRAVQAHRCGQVARTHGHAEDRAGKAVVQQLATVQRKGAQTVRARIARQQHTAVGRPHQLANVARPRVDGALQCAAVHVEKVDQVPGLGAARGAGHGHQRLRGVDGRAIKATHFRAHGQGPQHVAQLAAFQVPDAGGAVVGRGDGQAARGLTSKPRTGALCEPSSMTSVGFSTGVCATA